MTHADYLKKRDEIIVNVQCGWLDYNFAAQAIDALVNEVIGEDISPIDSPQDYLKNQQRKEQRTIVNGGEE
jgi:hypothetical protein